jgi:dihydroxyacetone kinase-like protein
MKKLINDPLNYVDESISGMVLAHPAHFTLTGRNRRVVTRSTPKPRGKVGIASGGGFGHLPLFAGYVGLGLLDSCAIGNVFSGPALEDVADALSAADRGAGVLSIIGNYGGDRMVFGTASDTLALEGKKVDTILVADDVASAPAERADTRRGVAGVVLAYKIAGAAAEEGRSLSDVADVTRRALTGCRSMGVALTSCTIPTAGAPTFDIEPDAIELGMGIHGERGLWRGPNRPADAIADEMARLLLDDLGPVDGSRVAVLLNSLGATPLDELYIMFRRLVAVLDQRNIRIDFCRVGHAATSMEMAGASVTFMLLDDELLALLNASAGCPHWVMQ